MRLSTLIVGAGPVGLTAALALTRHDISVAVVDAAERIDPRMRASTLHPPTLDMLDELGIGAGLLDAGRKVRRWQLRQHESGEHVVFDLQALAGDTAHPYRLQLSQQTLCELLLEQLDELGVAVQFERRVIAATQDNETVSVELEDGSTIRCDWLVGADGAGSAVRKSLGLEYAGRTYTHASVLVATPFRFDRHLQALCDVSYCWSLRGPFSLMRQRDLWRASLYPGVDDLETAAGEEQVREQLAYIAPQARDAELLDINPYRVHERCVDRFRVGRVLLAGDAAHINAPSGGMGMNGGIHDAVNLSGKLSQVIAGADDKLLDRYSRQRHFVASRAVIPQAAANRRRMLAADRGLQDQRLAEHRSIAADPKRCREFLRKSSMLTSLEEAARVE
ncbi:MAG: FAD-dependent monooxygenase [Pseudomonadota bacterium]